MLGLLAVVGMPCIWVCFSSYFEKVEGSRGEEGGEHTLILTTTSRFGSGVGRARVEVKLKKAMEMARVSFIFSFPSLDRVG